MAAPQSSYEPSAEEIRAALAHLAERAAAARRDPAALYEFVLREETTRRRIRIAPHQALILAFVMAHRKCIVRAPIGFGKTYLMTALTLFLLGQDNTQRGAVVSAAQGQSKKVVGACRSYIESSDELHLTFPELMPSSRQGDLWTQAAITVDRPFGIRDASLVAAGIGGKLPGARLSWANCDDLLTHENTASEQSRAHVRDWTISTVLTRQDAVDARVVICNVPWVAKTTADSVGDITYELEAEPYSWPSLTLDAHGDVEIRNTDWDSDMIRPSRVGENKDGVRHRLTAHDHPDYAIYAGEEPAPGWVDAEEQVPLWPEKFPWAVLDGLRQTLGSLEYVRGVRCKPRDERTSTVKVEWIEKAKQLAIEADLHRPRDAWEYGGSIITAVDPAFAKKKKSNRTSVLTFAVLFDGRRLVLENQCDKWGGTEIAQRVVSASRRFGSVVVVEGNAAQVWLKDLIKLQPRGSTVLVRTAFTGANKHDPRFGVQSIFLELEHGLWLLPNAGGKDERGEARPGKVPRGIDHLVSDLLEYDPNQHTGDSLMSLWIGREYARKLGLLSPAEDFSGEAATLAALLAR